MVKHLAYAYNVDYWDGKSQLNLAPEMLQLRYANYPKDYFMGILPNSQYGSVATLSPFNPELPARRVTALTTNAAYAQASGSGTGVSMSRTVSSADPLVLNADLSALSIRATEYLQRWKEVVQFSSKDYSDQMAAQFGIKAPEYMGNHAHYIGGWSSVININEVLNTNLNTQDSHASIAGKGISSNQGYTLTYDCGAEHQVIMCVYRAVLCWIGI